MFLLNQHPDHRKALDPVDAETLGMRAAEEVERYLTYRGNHAPTPLHTLLALAAELGVGAIHIKDEGFRLGLGSFKALGGSYAVIRLVLEEARRQLGHPIDVAELHTPEVRAVAQGAQLVGASAAIFVHSGVSDERVAAIARFGAQMIRVEGTYDDSVAEAARVAAQKGWMVVSDTSWPGYERIPGLVMQGYTAMVREALRQLPEPPTHVFVQAGVGGVAAAVAGHLALTLGDQRPIFIVVEPARAACLFETAREGHPIRIDHSEPTVMAMLECYEPSLVAWRVLSRVANAFMTVDEEDAVAVMNRLARPVGEDPAIVAGESGGAGLAGLVRAAADPEIRTALDLNEASRVFVINTEGATDPKRYAELVGMRPDDIVIRTGGTGA
jgi:diaminopropionate ammonia-lyase